MAGMEAFTPWLTPALLIALFAWLRSELIGRMDKRFDGVDKRFEIIDKRFESIDKRFESIDKRFDGMAREFADLRERMARLEGALEGFLAGRRDRDAA